MAKSLYAKGRELAKSGRLYATCRCCSRSDKTVKPRGGAAFPSSRIPPTPPLCDACWDDPALAYSECKHGLPRAAKGESA
jgi:hypothetical protein